VTILMTIDVESIGLYGEAFAVAGVVTDGAGATIEEFLYSCDPYRAAGAGSNRRWVAEKVPKIEKTHFDPRAVRSAFWEKWVEWKLRGALLFADCSFPVETNFLSACAKDDIGDREFLGPYPLHDVATFLLANGRNPLDTYARLTHELPVHHPLADARQSSRLLLECFDSSLTACD
jgi:hypothetical protein